MATTDEVLERKAQIWERRALVAESELSFIKSNPKAVLVAQIKAAEKRIDTLVKQNHDLQKQLDKIATLKMRGRFGSDPFEHGRPLV